MFIKSSRQKAARQIEKPANIIFTPDLHRAIFVKTRFYQLYQLAQ